MPLFSHYLKGSLYNIHRRLDPRGDFGIAMLGKVSSACVYVVTSGLQSMLHGFVYAFLHCILH